MRIGELATAANVSVETVRFYQRCGVLPLPAKPPGGIRCYSGQHVKLLQRIRTAREIGYSMVEIADAFSRFDQPCEVTRDYAKRRLARVDMKIRNLQRLSNRLEAWIEFCEEDSSRTVRDAIESTVGSLSEGAMDELAKKRRRGDR